MIWFVEDNVEVDSNAKQINDVQILHILFFVNVLKYISPDMWRFVFSWACIDICLS